MICDILKLNLDFSEGKMNFKKLFTILLCAVFCLGLFACGKNETAESTENDKLIMTINGHQVYEEDFKYAAQQYKTELENYVGETIDLAAEMAEGVTYGEYIIAMAENWFKYAEAVKSQAIRLGIGFDEEDEKTIDALWRQKCEQAGGEEGYLAYLEENGCSREMDEYIEQAELLSNKCFAAMYGENGANVSDEDCAEKTAEDGYIMAKHILILTSDEEGNEFSEDEKAAALARTENLLEILESCKEEDIYDKFDELMLNNSEDEGLSAYPDGYLFQEGDMEDGFYNAAAALKEGEFSGITETSNGYHIILRIPVNYDVVPIAYSAYASMGYGNLTLRYITADSMFQANINSWTERVEVTDTDGLDSLDIAALLAVG